MNSSSNKPDYQNSDEPSSWIDSDDDDHRDFNDPAPGTRGYNPTDYPY